MHAVRSRRTRRHDPTGADAQARSLEDLTPPPRHSRPVRGEASAHGKPRTTPRHDEPPPSEAALTLATHRTESPCAAQPPRTSAVPSRPDGRHHTPGAAHGARPRRTSLI
jgi:hypothetical protein